MLQRLLTLIVFLHYFLYFFFFFRIIQRSFSVFFPRFSSTSVGIQTDLFLFHVSLSLRPQPQGKTNEIFHTVFVFCFPFRPCELFNLGTWQRDELQYLANIQKFSPISCLTNRRRLACNVIMRWLCDRIAGIRHFFFFRAAIPFTHPWVTAFVYYYYYFFFLFFLLFMFF